MRCPPHPWGDCPTLLGFTSCAGSQRSEPAHSEALDPGEDGLCPTCPVPHSFIHSSNVSTPAAARALEKEPKTPELPGQGEEGWSSQVAPSRSPHLWGDGRSRGGDAGRRCVYGGWRVRPAAPASRVELDSSCWAIRCGSTVMALWGTGVC